MDHLRKIDHLVKLAAKNPAGAAHWEPRVLWDVFSPTSATEIAVGSGDAFVNEEPYPIIVQKAVIASVDASDDPAQLARVGIRLKFRDHAYMSRQIAACTHWQNQLSGGAYSTQWSTAHQVFAKPVVLGLRDALYVRAELTTAPASTRRLSVAFHGVGLRSLRPYILSDTVDATDTAQKTFQTARLRNDGSEPVALTGWSMTVSGQESSTSLYADTRVGRVQMRLIGNGTSTDWFKGPMAGGTSPGYTFMPVPLMGTDLGQGIVHRFPCDGIRLEPGQGMELEYQALDSNGTGVNVGVALHGMLQIR